MTFTGRLSQIPLRRLRVPEEGYRDVNASLAAGERNYHGRRPGDGELCADEEDLHRIPEQYQDLWYPEMYGYRRGVDRNWQRQKQD